jgi:hypothetical protein
MATGILSGIQLFAAGPAVAMEDSEWDLQSQDTFAPTGSEVEATTGAGISAALDIIDLDDLSKFISRPDSLWQKAVAIVASNSIWEPGLIRAYNTELDRKGYPKSIEMFWRRHLPGDSGEVRVDIVKAIKNGKDITEEKQKRVQQRLRKKDLTRGISEWALGLDGSSPFDPSLQNRIRYQRIELGGGPESTPCIAFRFIREMEFTAPLVGIAWLSEASGHPLEVRYTPTPPPGHVKEMEISMKYGLTPQDAWRPTDLVIDAFGKFLFFSKRLRSTIKITDYWLRTESTCER